MELYVNSILYKLLFIYIIVLGWFNIYSLDLSVVRVNRNWIIFILNCIEKGLDFLVCSILLFFCRFLFFFFRFFGIGDLFFWSWKYIIFIIGVFIYDDIFIYSKISML